MHNQPNKVTAKRLADLIRSQVVDTTLAYRIAEILKPFDGKQITKRMATAVQKALPECKVIWNADSVSLFYIEIYEARVGHSYTTCGNQILRVFIGHKSHTNGESLFNFERYQAEHDNCNQGAEDARNARRLRQCADTVALRKLAKAINAHNKALAEIDDTLVYNFEGKWAILGDFMAGPVGREGYL